MSALDWQTVVTNLQTFATTAEAATLEIANDLISEITEIGTPYTAAYTSQVDADKASDEARYAQELSEWEEATEPVHDQAATLLNYVEGLYYDLTVASYPAFDPDEPVATSNFILMSGRLAIYKAKTQSTMNLNTSPTRIEGLPALIVDLQRLFIVAYNSRPVQTYTGTYGTPVVTVPGKGLLTVQQTEVLLDGLMDEARDLMFIY